MTNIDRNKTRTRQPGNNGVNEPAVVVIGAGIVGMAIAMMLAKRDLPVVVIERDSRDSIESHDEYPAVRAGAPHAHRPHTLLTGAWDILLRSLPEVAREVCELGAREGAEDPNASPAMRGPLLALRRVLLERALLTCARDLPTLTLRFSERVIDLAMMDERRVQVRGVQTTKTTLPAKLVIDATGTNTRLAHNPSSAAFSCIKTRSSLYYTSQPFRLSDEGFVAAEPTAALWTESPSEAVAVARVFVHDRPYASVLVALQGDKPPDRRIVLESYRAVLSSRQLHGCLQKATPLAPIQSFGFLRTRLRLPDNPVFSGVAGIHQIGDAVATVNPLTSRGVALGLIQAEALADAIARDVADYESQREVAIRIYHEWVAAHWAMSALQGSQRPNAQPPPEVTEILATARRRWRRIHEIRTASREPATDGLDRSRREDQMKTVLRVLRLQAPPSVLDSLD